MEGFIAAKIRYRWTIDDAIREPVESEDLQRHPDRMFQHEKVNSIGIWINERVFDFLN